MKIPKNGPFSKNRQKSNFYPNSIFLTAFERYQKYLQNQFLYVKIRAENSEIQQIENGHFRKFGDFKNFQSAGTSSGQLLIAQKFFCK